ncbi:MAG: T9SS C-terminal target domain-containing protein [Candidatus Zixiibacteriota bacterium]|nr:MAG: T9SS C-terminal target domain-containing protein [candidate division Zixibacteria bacterium]
MRYLLPVLLLALLLAGPASAQIEISGPLSGALLDTTYHVTGQISVPQGQILVIPPGAVLTFYTTSNFSISGILLAQGTTQDSIRFEKGPGNEYWEGLDFYADADASILAYCHISGSHYCGVQLNHADISIRNCTLRDNWSVLHGGGIYCQYSDAQIHDCVIIHNSSYDYGGGICCTFSSPDIRGCVVAGNYPWSGSSYRNGFGGGIWCRNASHARISNCLIAANYAFRDGSGLHADNDCAVQVVHCTILDNVSLGQQYGTTGHGVFLDHPQSAVTNSIVRGNEPLQVLSGGSVTFCDIEGGFPGSGNIAADPLFVSGPLGDYYISQTAAGQPVQSPCVDAGDPHSPLIAGTTRTDGSPDAGIVDMGYHYPLPVEDITLAEHENELQLHPSSFTLHPFTPNPFNPSTVARYELQAASYVNLRVYDTAGREVATLVDGWRVAGSHEVTFDASGLPSGLYLARLQAGDFTQTQKLVLLK